MGITMAMRECASGFGMVVNGQGNISALKAV